MIKNNLKEIRMTEYMLNLSEMAVKLGVPISTYSQWEKNNTKPNLELALQVALMLDKKVDEIWFIA